MNDRNTALIVTGATISVALSALDVSITTIATPTIIKTLHGSLSQVSWVFLAYLGAALLALPWSGIFADRIPSHRVLSIGLLTFGVGSIGCAVAASMPIFLMFRVIQGVGGGCLMALPIIIVGKFFKPSERARWQGVLAAGYGIATLVGPPLGGFVTATAGWPFIFVLNIPFVFMALLMLNRIHLPFRPTTSEGQWVNILLFNAVIGLVLVAIYEWTIRYGLAEIILALGCALIFIRQARDGHSMLWPTGVTQNVVIVSLGVMVLMAAGIESGAIYAPIIFQHVFHVTPVVTGLLLIPMSLISILASLWSGKIMSKTGIYRRLLLWAEVNMGLGFGLVMVGLQFHTLTIVLLSTMVFGLGLGLQQPIIAVVVQAVTPKESLGAISSLLPLLWNVGAWVGLLLTTIEFRVFPESLSWTVVYGVALLMIVIAAWISLRLPPRRLQEFQGLGVSE